MVELKDCPFCGCIARLEEQRSVRWVGVNHARATTKYIARCVLKGCLGHHNKAYVSKERAIENWNHRYQDLVDQMKLEGYL